jgi:amino acid transporter
MSAVVILTILWIIISGFLNQLHNVKFFPTGSESFFTYAFWAAVGQGSVKTVYSYLGYYNVCHLGGEIKKPEKNIPRSIFISIVGIALLYMLMNISVIGVLDWHTVKEDDKYLVSSFMAQIYGHEAGMFITVLILCIAFSSLFAVVLGYSRIPYAAAVDGNFFKIFSRLHPTKNFPYVSLIVICTMGLIFSLIMKLTDVISSILAMRILVQFIGQGIGLILLRKNYGSASLPFKMWLYPLPVIISILIWLFLFVSTGWFSLWGTLIAIGGVFVYFFVRRFRKTQLVESLSVDLNTNSGSASS